LSKLEVKAFDLNYKNERLLMPYSQKYKIGDGFDVKEGLSKSCPFYLPALILNPPHSIEG